MTNFKTCTYMDPRNIGLGVVYCGVACNAFLAVNKQPTCQRFFKATTLTPPLTASQVKAM